MLVLVNKVLAQFSLRKVAVWDIGCVSYTYKILCRSFAWHWGRIRPSAQMGIRPCVFPTVNREFVKQQGIGDFFFLNQYIQVDLRYCLVQFSDIICDVFYSFLLTMWSHDLAKILMQDPLDLSLLLDTKCLCFIWGKHLTVWFEMSCRRGVFCERILDGGLFGTRKWTSRISS